MGKALYRKYRSKSLSEIVGQEHITRALDRAVKENHISHAYLFTGPRGTGKTSIARIMAFTVNELPYQEDSTHLDIIEIDAASNNGVEDVRDLREKVFVAPSSAKYKVYIIDEVHMLSKAAFNALLKTLEEPPAHVLFILATTEMQKLPETIISRTQHFAFKPVPMPKVIEHLKFIAEQEKITIDEEALQLLAEHGGGSFRDSISLLDQARNYAEKITGDDIRALIGVAPESSIETLLEAIVGHDIAGIVETVKELHEQGIEAPVLAKQLIARLQSDLLNGRHTIPASISLELIGKLIEIPASISPKIALQIALLQPAIQGQAPDTSVSVTAKFAEPVLASPEIAEKPAKKQPEALKPTVKAPEAEEIKPEEIANKAPNSKPAAKPTVTDSAFISDQWPSVLLHIKQKYNTLYGVLRMAQPEFSDNTLRLTFKFAFHHKKISDPKNVAIVLDAVEKVSGQKAKLICEILEEGAENPAPLATAKPAAQPTDSPLGTISNIFGGGELLES
jgi:DNA polymerase-3 subunit gamma/tau